MKLVEIDLKLEQIESLAGHLDPKFVLEEFSDLWIADSAHIVHCFEHIYIFTMLWSKLFF